MTLLFLLTFRDSASMPSFLSGSALRPAVRYETGILDEQNQAAKCDPERQSEQVTLPWTVDVMSEAKSIAQSQAIMRSTAHARQGLWSFAVSITH